MTEPAHTQSYSGATAKRGLVFGLLAGAAMVFATVAMRLTGNALSITELAAERFTEILPGAVIDFLLETLTFSAKPLMLVGLLIAQVMVGGVVGALYGRLSDRWPAADPFGELNRALRLGLLLWLVSMVALVPALGGGVFGTGAPGGSIGFILTSLGSFVVYGLSLGALLARIGQGSLFNAVDSSRRAFLRRVAVWAVVLVAAGYGLKFVLGQVRTQGQTSGAFRTHGVLSAEVTPNDEFYLVSKNLIDPQVGLAGWDLEIGGLVERPYSLTYEELTSMPPVEEFVTLECISNSVGGDLISNARWTGVPLRLILERAGLEPGVVDISFKASDGYEESIPLEMAMRGEVLVAYEMNGVPLPSRHGFPARLIVPGFFGLKHVKWLTSIEPVNFDVMGFWQRRGWTDVPHVKTFSRFDIPESGRRSTVSDDSIVLGGVAFAGDRGISNVEVSADLGKTWTSVDHVSEPLSPYTWVIWTKAISTRDLKPLKDDEVVLSVRATDGDGVFQTDEEMGSLPDGASGHHVISVLAPVRSVS